MVQKRRWWVGLVALLVVAATLSSVRTAGGQGGGEIGVDFDYPGLEQVVLLNAYTNGMVVPLTGTPVDVFGTGLPEENVTEIHAVQQTYLGDGAKWVAGLRMLDEAGELPAHWILQDAGIESFFSTSGQFNHIQVIAPLDAVTCGEMEYRELAVFEFYSAEFTVRPDPLAPGDPGVGAASAFSALCNGDLDTSFYGIGQKTGRLSEFDVPISMLEMRLAEYSVWNFFTPRNVELSIVLSRSDDTTPTDVPPAVGAVSFGLAATTGPAIDPANIPVAEDLPGDGPATVTDFLTPPASAEPEADTDADATNESNSAEDDSDAAAGADDVASSDDDEVPLQEIDNTTAIEEGGPGGDDGVSIWVWLGLLAVVAFIMMLLWLFLVRPRPKRAPQKIEPGGGMTTPTQTWPVDEMETVAPADLAPASNMTGGGWVELPGGDDAQSAHRRAAAAAEGSGAARNENDHVVPTAENWDDALDGLAPKGDGLDGLRENVRNGLDPSGPRPEGVPESSTIEVDPRTGRAFWRPPGGAITPGTEDLPIA